jgi:UDP-glucose 4-epimerase
VRPARAKRVVAITGAASFLGRNLVGLLEEDEHVDGIVALDLSTPITAGAKTRAYEIDLTSPIAEERASEIFSAERVDCVVHLAFLSSPTHARGWAHELESVGTMRLLNAARLASVRKLVLWSQTLLYGAHPTNPNFLSERHPLRAPLDEAFFADKIEAEAEANRFARRTGNVVTILRTAAVVGPTVKNYLSNYLARRLVPTMMGFDPLWQLLHEADAVAAFRLAILRDVPGTFNIVGDGVLPLTTIIKLAGRVATPVPHMLLPAVAGALWMAQLAEAPAAFLDYLRYVCVADGEKARAEMGFVPAYTTREALIDYTSAQRLRDVRLLHETPA